MTEANAPTSAFATSPFLHQFAFDNTSLAYFKECPRKYYYSIVEGWRKKGKAPALVFGGLYHEGVEKYDALRAKDWSHESALKCMVLYVSMKFEEDPIPEGDTKRNYLTLMRSLIWYAEENKHSEVRTANLPGEVLGLELSFRFELPFHGPEGPYIYCGHIDKIAEYKGQKFVVERKHTTSALGDFFYQRYALSDQITGYHLAGKVIFQVPIAGSMIEATQVAVNFSRFDRRMVLRADALMEEWLELTEHYIRRTTEEFEKLHEGAPAFLPNHESCNKFGGCVFLEVCSKSPFMRKSLLEADFEKQPWQPLKNRTEGTEE